MNFVQRSIVLSMNLYVRKWSPRPIPPPSWLLWGGFSCPLPGNLLSPGIKPTSLISSALAGEFFTTSATWESQWILHSNFLSFLGITMNADFLFSMYFIFPCSIYICIKCNIFMALVLEFQNTLSRLMIFSSIPLTLNSKYLSLY